MLLDGATLTIGLILLLGAAYYLVSSAVTISLSLGISRVIVGLTAVAFGTSTPEFLVSLVAGLRDSSGVALGNVLGSNVANVGLVLGMAAVIAPMRVHARLVHWEIPILGAATAAILLMGLSGAIQQWEGGLMVAGLTAFLLVSLRFFPETVADIELDAEVPSDDTEQQARSLVPQVGLLVGSVGVLAIASQLAVAGATGISQRFGVSDFVIGVTVIAVGTSLPELVTSVVAAFRREHDIAVANVIGSNIFNLLGVIGLTSTVVPLSVDGGLYRFEMIALAVSTVILIPLAWPRYRIGRAEGFMLLGVYATFTVLVIARGSAT